MAAAGDDWVIKESKSHKGTYYKYNTASGKSEWLTPNEFTKAAPPPQSNGIKLSPLGATQSSSVPQLNLTGNRSLGISPSKGSGRRPLTRSSHATQVSWGTEDTSEGSECICTICECGKHHCPLHGMQAPNPFAGNSRYREDYPKHPLHASKMSKPTRVVEATPADPDQFKSKYAEDFKPFIPEPPASMKPKTAAPVHVPFDGTTTNKAAYQPKPVNMRPTRRPPSPPRITAPFEGTTTNRESHCPFPESRPRESMAPPSRKAATLPFEGTTQYKKDYTPHPGGDRPKRENRNEAYEYGPKRAFPTEHRSQYIPKPINYCPVLDLNPKDPSNHTGHIHYTKNQRPGYKYYPGKGGTLRAADLDSP